LLEDEALRGDLDDVTWAPLQAWVLRVAGRVAAGTAGVDDPAAQAILDRASRVLKAVVAALASALAVGTGSAEFARRVASLDGDLQPPVLEAAHARQAREILRQTARQLAAAQADGPTAAARLVEALEVGATGAPPSARPETP
jgi:hypothetical protein